jgi:prolyl oligopeptidase
MAALMLKFNKDITYYENIEGGHGGAANSEQQAHMSALLYCFLYEKLVSVRKNAQI